MSISLKKREYFKALAITASEQSTCVSKRVGCVFVSSEDYVLSIGYNGVPKGFTHCEDNAGGCHRPNGACEDTIHAEQNALIQASLRGISLKGSTAFVTLTPCKQCALTLIQLKVTAVYCRDLHSSFKESIKLLKQVSIPVYSWDGVLMNFD